MSNGQRTCSVDGCDRPHRSKGWCNAHYSRVLRNGVPGGLIPAKVEFGEFCHVPECEKPRRRGERHCSMHTTRLRKHGDVNAVHIWGPGSKSQRWQGDDVTYHSAHSRVRRLRGRASEHSCANCGSTAADWAYDHEDEFEKVGTSRTGRTVATVRYSTDPNHYIPMCKSCHISFDNADRKSRKAAKAAEHGGQRR